MSPDPQNPRVPWLDASLQRPICDVPWLGNSVVLSNGDVNFCCFSDAVAGNVNEASFEQIWNGDFMQRLRMELAASRLPAPCQTLSCPIFRGDTADYVHKRMDGLLDRMFTRTPEPVEVRSHLHVESCVSQFLSARAHGLHVKIRMQYDGPVAEADFFAGVRHVDGSMRFLPADEAFPVPFVCGLQLADSLPEWNLILSESARIDPAKYELCLALFEKNSNPHIASNCYWSECRTMPAKPEHRDGTT